jgi:phosphosulfolactate phosphohydrolase-like enzyme
MLAFLIASEVTDDHYHENTATMTLEHQIVSNKRPHEATTQGIARRHRDRISQPETSASPLDAINQHPSSSSLTMHTSNTTIAQEIQEILLQYLRQAKRLMKKWVKLCRTTGVDSFQIQLQAPE